MDFNGLTATLHNFIAAFSGGYGRLSGAINGLLALLGGIDLVLVGFWWALGGGEQLAAVFRKLLYIGFWIWMVRSFPTISKAFVDSLVQAGFTAGGGGADQSLLMDPSRIAGMGLDATAPLAQKIEDLTALDVSDLFVFGLAYIGIMLSFLIMAMNVFLAVLEYYMIAAIVGILMPFGLLSGTKFLAEKAIGAVVASGVKLCVLGFVLSVSDPVIRNIRFAGDEITLNELWAMFLTVSSLMLLCWKAPSLASNLLSGAPALGAHDFARPVQTAVVAAIGAFTGARAGDSHPSSSPSARQGSTLATSQAANAHAESGAKLGASHNTGSASGRAQSSSASAGSSQASASTLSMPAAPAALVRSAYAPPENAAPTPIVSPPVNPAPSPA